MVEAGSADRSRFRGIARGSAMECGAILDVVRLFQVAPQADWVQAKSLLVRIVEMTRTRTRTRTGQLPN